MKLWDNFRDILTSKTPDPDPRSGRRHQRFDMRAAITLSLLNDDATPQEPVKAWVRNLSAGGICVVCNVPIDSGQRFISYVLHPDPDHTLEIYCLAIRCKMVADEIYQIGARFIAKPSGTTKDRAPDAQPAEEQPAPLAEDDLQRIRKSILDNA
jgi:hypothetical protein